VLLVDDGCPLDSWSEIQKVAQSFPEVEGFRLSRNFGQHSAIEAGLTRASGQWIVVMDCDLQDRPEDIAKLWKKTMSSDAEVLIARRAIRHESLARRIVSRLFYWVLSALTGQYLDPSIGNFGIYHARVIKAYCSWSEAQKYFPVMIQWLGFRQTTVDVTQQGREHGTSAYTFTKLVRLAADVILSFSDRPLWIAASLGLVIAISTFLVSAYVFITALVTQVPVQGWTSIMLSIWFLGGVLLLGAGMMGIYVGRVLREAKGRPSFVIAENVRQ
jgi:dolichol-phosphate mannosyltransferase